MTDAGSTRRLAITGTLSAALTGLAVVGVFLIAPEDSDQGILQKTSYFHAATALPCPPSLTFVFAYALRFPPSRNPHFP